MGTRGEPHGSSMSVMVSIGYSAIAVVPALAIVMADVRAVDRLVFCLMIFVGGMGTYVGLSHRKCHNTIAGDASVRGTEIRRGVVIVEDRMIVNMHHNPKCGVKKKISRYKFFRTYGLLQSDCSKCTSSSPRLTHTVLLSDGKAVQQNSDFFFNGFLYRKVHDLSKREPESHSYYRYDIRRIL